MKIQVQKVEKGNQLAWICTFKGSRDQSGLKMISHGMHSYFTPKNAFIVPFISILIFLHDSLEHWTLNTEQSLLLFIIPGWTISNHQWGVPEWRGDRYVTQRSIILYCLALPSIIRPQQLLLLILLISLLLFSIIVIIIITNIIREKVKYSNDSKRRSVPMEMVSEVFFQRFRSFLGGGFWLCQDFFGIWQCTKRYNKTRENTDLELSPFNASIFVRFF